MVADPGSESIHPRSHEASTNSADLDQIPESNGIEELLFPNHACTLRRGRSVPPSRPKHTPNRITCPCGPVHTSDGATDGGHEDPLGPFEIREEVFRYYGSLVSLMRPAHFATASIFGWNVRDLDPHVTGWSKSV